MNVEIIKSSHIGKKISKKRRPLLIRFSNYETKAKILSKSFILHQTNSYENIFVSTDMTKAEQARHKLLVEKPKSRRARGKLILSFRRIVLSLDPNSKDSKLRSRILEVVHWK